MTPDLIAKLCCGAVTGGVKFCTLNSATCTFTSHAVKKVSVTEGDIYISTGCNSAFSNHHAPASPLSEADLQELLKEHHTEKGWVNLLQVINTFPDEHKQLEENGGADSESSLEPSVLASVTPRRKRKECYIDMSQSPLDPVMSGKLKAGLSSTNSSFDDELIIVPSAYFQDLSDEEKLSSVLGQWDLVISTLNKTTSVIKNC